MNRIYIETVIVEIQEVRLMRTKKLLEIIEALNFIEKKSFIMRHVLLTCLFAVWYIEYSGLFQYVARLRMIGSAGLLVMLTLGIEALGILLTYNHYKNNFFVVINSIIPFGTYTIISHFETIIRETLLILIVVVILVFMFASYILEERPEHKKQYKMIRHYQWECAVVVSWGLLAGGLLAIMIGYAYDSWLDALRKFICEYQAWYITKRKMEE